MSLLPYPETSGVDATDLATAEQNYQTPLGDYLLAKVKEGFWNSTPGQAVAQYGAYGDFRTWAEGPTDMKDFHARMRAAMNDQPQPPHDYGPVMSEADWKGSQWFREGLQWDERMSDKRAQALADTFDDNQYRRWQIDHSPTGLRSGAGFVGMMVGGAPDPINYIPFLGPATKAAAVARYGVIGGRAIVSGAEAAMGAALAAPVVTASQRQFGDDVTFADTVTDIAVAGVFGAVFGSAVGGWSRYRASRAAHDFHTVAQAHEMLGQAVGDVANGRPVEVSPATLADIAERKAQDIGLRPAPVDPPVVHEAPEGVRVIDPGDKVGLTAWVKEALATPGNKLKAWLGGVSDTNARAVADGAGVDITGYRRVWEQSYVRHVDNKHGPESPSARNGHMDITPEQMALVNEVVDNPDRVARTVTDRGRDAILYERRIGDYFLYVEEVRAGKKTLAIDTMYRRPTPDDAAFAKAKEAVSKAERERSGGPDAPSPAGSPHGLRPETTPALHENIGQTASDGKSGHLGELAPSYVERPLDTSPTPHPPIPDDVKAAEASVGHPSSGVEAAAKDLGVDPRTGEFDERAMFEQLHAEGKLHPEEIDAIRTAEEAMQKAENYSRAYEAAAACLTRKS